MPTSSKKYCSLKRRFQSLIVVVVFLVTNCFPSSALAISQPDTLQEKGTVPRGNSPLFSVSTLHVPAEIGKIEEVFQARGQESAKKKDGSAVQFGGTRDKRQESFPVSRPVPLAPFVILIQDAHAIPDAQRNIQKLIEHFQKEYGVGLVAIEGASSELDPQIFKSFPDKEILQKTLNDYFERGELTGATAASIFSERQAVYQGIEDWKLYEEGLGFYLKAMEKEEVLIDKFQAARRRLQGEKEKIYSKELMEVDKTLEAFRRNEVDLMTVLKQLRQVAQKRGQSPEKGTVPVSIQALLEEIEKEGNDQSTIEREVREIAEEIKKHLLQVTGRKPQDDEDPAAWSLKLAAFNQTYQEFQTSRISPEAFALFTKELIESGRGSWGMSLEKVHTRHTTQDSRLAQLMKNHKHLRDIQGTQFFRDFEAYVKSVKESLFRNDDERRLNTEGRKLELLEKLVKLELSRGEWEELKTITNQLNGSVSFSSIQTNKPRRLGRQPQRQLLRPFEEIQRERLDTSAFPLSGGFSGHAHQAIANSSTMLNPKAIFAAKSQEENQTYTKDTPINISTVRNRNFEMASRRYGSNIEDTLAKGYSAVNNKNKLFYDLKLYINHGLFYQNAEKRDEMFLNNLLKLMNLPNVGAASRGRPFVEGQAQGPAPTILIAGGFHTEGLARQFKEKGISYVVVRPEIGTVPETSLYRQHMRGEVSWNEYFEVENGKVNLYKAFVRGARDRLLGVSRESWVLRKQKDQENPSRLIPQDSRLLLKSWRDQILRDLAQKEELAKAHQYTQFLDEISQDSRHKTQAAGLSTNYDVQKKWLTKIDRFIQGLRYLNANKKLTEQNIVGLLGRANIPDSTGAVLALQSEIRAELLGLDTANIRRAEMRPASRVAGTRNYLRTGRSEVRAANWSESKMVSIIQTAARIPAISLRPEDIESEKQLATNIGRLLQQVYRASNKQSLSWQDLLAKAGLNPAEIFAKKKTLPVKRAVSDLESPKADVKPKPSSQKPRKPSERRRGKREVIEVIKEAKIAGLLLNPGRIQSKEQRSSDLGDELFSYYRSVILRHVDDLSDWATALREAGEDPEKIMKGSGKAASKRFWTKELGTQIIREVIEHNKINPQAPISLSPGKITKSKEQLTTEFGKKVYGYYHAIREKRIEGIENWKQALTEAGEKWEDHFEGRSPRRSEVRLARQEPSTAQDVRPRVKREEAPARYASQDTSSEFSLRSQVQSEMLGKDNNITKFGQWEGLGRHGQFEKGASAGLRRGFQSQRVFRLEKYRPQFLQQSLWISSPFLAGTEYIKHQLLDQIQSSLGLTFLFKPISGNQYKPHAFVSDHNFQNLTTEVPLHQIPSFERRLSFVGVGHRFLNHFKRQFPLRDALSDMLSIIKYHILYDNYKLIDVKSFYSVRRSELPSARSGLRTPRVLKPSASRAKVRLARQEPSTVRDVQLSAARSELRGKDEQIQRLQDAYRRLEIAKAGAREEIGDIAALVNLKYGQFQWSFPLPNGNRLGDNRQLGSGKNLKSVSLVLEKRKDGLLYYMFSYEKEDSSKGTVEHYWDEEKQDLISASGRDQQRLELQEAYKKFVQAKVGAQEELEDIDSLVNFKSGKFQMSFPLPNGQRLGDNRPVGSGKNLKSISLWLEKRKEGRLYYVFSYEKEDGSKGTIEHYWDKNKQDLIQGVKLESEQDLQILKLQKVYKKLEKTEPGAREEIGDVDELVNLKRGQLQQSFHLPNGENLRDVRQLGSGANLASVSLVLQKRKDGRLYYVFSYEKKEGGKGTVEHYWDEEKEDLISASYQDLQILNLLEAYKRLAKAKAGTREEIVDFSELVNLKRGQLQHSFHLPNGENLGEVRQLGSGQGLKSVSLMLEKRNDGRLYYVFSYEKENGGKGTVEHYWDQTKQDLLQGVKLESEQDLQILKLQEAYRRLEKAKIGEKEAIEDIDGLVNLKVGRFQKSFPLPNGKSVGDNWQLGSGTNLTSLSLLLEKRKDSRLYYIFSYEKKEDSKRTVEHYWDEVRNDLVKVESEQDRQMRKLQEAYRKLEKAEPGAREELEEVGELVYLKWGKFQGAFPLPDGKSLRDNRPLGSGTNLTKVSLVLEKRKDGRLYYVFSYEKENGSKGTVEHSWDSAKEKLVRAGEDVDAGDAIDKYDFAEAVALLGNDPLRLLQYLRIYHPELSPEETDHAAAASLRGLRGEGAEREELHLDYKEILREPEVTQDVQATHAHSFLLSGRTTAGTPFIQVIGAYTRKIAVRQDGSFSASIPLPRTGETNEFSVYAFDPESSEKSPAVVIRVDQTGQKEDAEDAFLRLLALKKEKLESIQQNPARYEFLLRSVEQSLLKHFTYDEKAGLRYLEDKIKNEKSKAQKTILDAVLKKFKKIKEMNFNIKKGERPYFFQKYTAYEIQSLMTKGSKGVIVANEQGTGKTVIALMVMNGKEGVILTPNSVVSTWAEQEEQFIPKADLEVLEGSYAEREGALRDLKKPQVVTNIEFTRGMNEKKADLLSRPQGILVVDEADYLGSKLSQQAKGTRQIGAGFKLLLTATPFKRISQIGELLQFIRPDDSRFSSARAFARTFPAEDREAMNALFLLMQEHTIRIRKRDVFETYDPAVSLEKQSDRLPAKEKISPEATGKFDLHEVQSQSILELFTDPESWMRKHKGGHESVEDKQYYRYKEGYFSKREALRQIMNDPAYIGRPDIESPKHLEMDQIVKKELSPQPAQKMLIFTRYRAQVEEYKQRYAAYGVRTYYGGLPQNANGYKVDENRNVLYYKVDEYENPVLENGKLVETDKEHGRPVRALDYERILFQNDPDSRIMVATYDAGAVGVTFTAADIVVFDDLAQTYRDEYQAEDRAHRIDNKRKKYKVKYYWLQARYPESFLRKLPKEIREQYFSMGTFDQVQYENLRNQAHIFHRVMDGVGSEEELGEANQRFMSQRMPFMFVQGEVGDETPDDLIDEENPENSSDTPSETRRSELRAPKPLTPEQIADLVMELDNGLEDVLSGHKEAILSTEKSRKVIRIKSNGTISLFEVTDDAGTKKERRLEIADADYPLVSELMKRADIGIDAIELEYGENAKNTRYDEQAIDMRELLIDFFIREAKGDKKHTALLLESERYQIMEYSESPRRRRFVLKRTDPKIDLSHVPEVQEALTYLRRYAVSIRTIEANPWVADIWVRVNDYTREKDHASPTLLRLAEHLRRGNLSRKHRGEIQQAIDLLENPAYGTVDRYDREKGERAVKDVIAFIREHLWTNPEKILFNDNPELLKTFNETREHLAGQKIVGLLAEVERKMNQKKFDKHKDDDSMRLQTIFEFLLGIDTDSAKSIFHEALERLLKLYQSRPQRPILRRDIFPETFKFGFHKNGIVQIIRLHQPTQPYIEAASDDLARLLAHPALNIQFLTVQFDGKVKLDSEFLDYFEGVLTDYLLLWATQDAKKLQSVPQNIRGVLSATYRFLEAPDKYQPPDLAPSAHTLTLARSELRLDPFDPSTARDVEPFAPRSELRPASREAGTPLGTGRSELRNDFEDDRLVWIIQRVKAVLDDYVTKMRQKRSRLKAPLFTRQVIEQLVQFREDLERYEQAGILKPQDIRDPEKKDFILLMKQIRFGEFVDERPYVSREAHGALEQLLKMDLHALLPPPPPEPITIERILYDPKIKGLQVTVNQQTRIVTNLSELKDILKSAGITVNLFERDPKTGRQLLEFRSLETGRMTREYENDWERIARGLNYLLTLDRPRSEVRTDLQDIRSVFKKLMNAIEHSFPSAGKPLAEVREMIEKENLEGARPKIEEALKAFRSHTSKDLFKKAIQSLESFRYSLLSVELQKQEESLGKKWALEILKALAADQIGQARHLYTNHRSELTPVQREILKTEIYLTRVKPRSEVRKERIGAIENFAKVITNASENQFAERNAKQLITYIEVRGVKRLRSELRKAVTETYARRSGSDALSVSRITDKVWREESEALVRTLGSDSANKTLDKAGTIALVLSESLGKSLAENFVKGIERSNLDTVALIGKGQAAADLANRLKPYDINVRPLSNLRRSLGKDEAAAIPTGIFDRRFHSQINKAFLPFWIEQGSVDNPLVKDYVEALQIVALFHTAQILQTKPQLLKDRVGLRAELLKRLAFFEGFDSLVSVDTWQGQSGFAISAVAAQAYLEHRSQLRIRQAA